MTADELIEKAERLGDDDEHAQALAILDRVLAMKLAKPKRVRALMARASVYDDRDDDDLQDHARAIADCDAALAIAPSSPDVLYLRATIYSSAGDWAACKRDLDTAIAIEGRPDLFELRGMARYNLGDYPGARADFATAIARNEDIEPRFHVYRGMAALLLDKPADAIPDFTAALEREPDELLALAQRAKAYEACGQLAAALADLDRLHGLVPKSPTLDAHRKQLRIALKRRKG